MLRLRSLFLCMALAACTHPQTLHHTPATTAEARSLPAGGDVEGVAVGTQGAVSAAEDLAANVGLRILQQGGNAIDAAVAVGFAMAVTHPTAGNLGGGGFMVVRLASGDVVAIDYRETAPAAATPDMYLDEKGEPTDESVIGPKAAGIPGTVAGLALAHARFGSLPFKTLVEPAIALARYGHPLDENHAGRLDYAVKRMRMVGQDSSSLYYTKSDGSPLHAGDLWKQPELAATLQVIADGGADAFYRGPFAARFADGVRKLGGIWTAEDLATYKARERAPLSFEYLGHRVHSMPLPSAGGIVLRQVLGGSEVLHMANYPFLSPEAEHLFIEATRRAYADRNMLLGDPDFVQVPVAELTSMPYIESRMATVDPKHATPSSEVRPGLVPNGREESHETTHYSVVDKWGNAVANTYTLNTGFGAKVIVPGTGILLNNEMDDFAVKPGDANVYGLVQGRNNRVQPGKRMLSSMTPTIIEKDGQLRAVLGTPGGPTITNTVAQITRAIIDYGKPLDVAVRAPRVHHQWFPDQVFVEPDTPQSLIEGLEAMGHKVVVSSYGPMGHANCIEVDPQTRGYRAVADVTRGKGGAARAY